ncbi:hypothetical protein AAC387_Pa03g1827 [Persea americana]
MVKEDLCSTVADFFVKGIVEPRTNETTIILILKKESPRSLKDYQPSSLYNVNFKIIAKILVHHLRPILGQLISPTQGAFVPRRKALDQIVVA